MFGSHLDSRLIKNQRLARLFLPGQMVERAASVQGLNVDEQQIIKLITFLRSGNLTHEDESGNWRELAQKAAAVKKSPLQQLTYKHLFFKLPLIRPQRMLEATQHLVAPFYTRTFAVILLICGLSGLYLVSRQWDQFLGTFSMLFSFEGILYFLLSLVILKISHELGHAYTAVRFGSRVASMGVAFMLMTPLLYTDVSDAWRLSSRKKRMIISAAGMTVELALALIATFLWAFLPDGALRSIVFMIATTGWVMSLAFNLNPLLKFDGYYLFSDFLGIDNLQSRAFALGRWKLRRVLFAPDLPPSEQFSPGLQNGLILYALITWLYRLVIFTAIALFVYTFTFKLLGLFLFALEIWLLVLHPVWREIRNWPEVNAEFISRRRIGISASLVAAFVLGFIAPWSTRIEIPAVLVASDLAYIYPPRAAEVISISAERGETVSKGSPWLRLQEPEIDSQIIGTRVRRNLTRVRLSQAMADRTELDLLLVLSQELNSQQSRLDGLANQKQEMVVRAPIKGRLLQLATDLHPGRWVGKSDLLAIIASGDKHQVKGYVSGDNLQRLSEDAIGRFIPEDLGRAAFLPRSQTNIEATKTTLQTSRVSKG